MLLTRGRRALRLAPAGAFAAALLALVIGFAWTPSLPGPRGWPRLTLSVEPVESRPRAMRFIAHLTGGLDSSPGLYCQTSRWDYGDGQIAAIMPFCPRWTPTAKAQRYFEHVHTYDVPGEYGPTFSYGKLASPSVRVMVP